MNDRSEVRRKFSSWVRDLIRNNLLRSFKYSISGFVGFLTLELLTFISLASIGSEYLVIIDLYSFFLAILVEFLINEHWTTRSEGDHRGGRRGFFYRLMRFELLNVFGNLVTFSVEFGLFRFFNLSPLIGNLIGSGLAFPVNYYLQMKNVWSIDPLEMMDQ